MCTNTAPFEEIIWICASRPILIGSWISKIIVTICPGWIIPVDDCSKLPLESDRITNSPCAGADYGNHSVNRFMIIAQQLGDTFNEVEFHLNGSGAIDNLVFGGWGWFLIKFKNKKT